MLVIQRLLAVLIIVIPGILAGYGWNLMRDAIFDKLGSAGAAFPVLKLLIGGMMFLLGVAFIAGFYVYRDKKKKNLTMGQIKNPEK